jgi:hypothetical protein
MAPIGCATPGCGRVALTRGCCPRHYKELLARVRAGEATWEQLEARGACRPANRDALRRTQAGRGLVKAGGSPS